MLETQLLSGELFPSSPRHRNRWRLRGADDLEIARPHLDLAGLHLRVSHLGRTRGDFTFEGNYCLQTELAGALDYIAGCPVRIEGHLNESSAIAQVEENDSAEIPRTVDPAAESDFGADVRRSELAAQMGAPSRRETGSRGRGGQRGKLWVE
jgi:hypothetical protein